MAGVDEEQEAVQQSAHRISLTERAIIPLLAWEDRVERAITLKEEGNTRYRAGNYSAAISKYRLALAYLDLQLHAGDVTQPDTEQMDRLNALLIDCHNNLAASYLEMTKAGRSSYKDVLDQCDAALSLNPRSIKALYRKAVALYHVKRYSDAIDVLTQASTLPDPLRTSLDANIQRYMRLCQETLDNIDKKQHRTSLL